MKLKSGIVEKKEEEKKKRIFAFAQRKVLEQNGLCYLSGLRNEDNL